MSADVNPAIISQTAVFLREAVAHAVAFGFLLAFASGIRTHYPDVAVPAWIAIALVGAVSVVIVVNGAKGNGRPVSALLSQMRISSASVYGLLAFNVVFFQEFPPAFHLVVTACVGLIAVCMCAAVASFKAVARSHDSRI